MRRAAHDGRIAAALGLAVAVQLGAIAAGAPGQSAVSPRWNQTPDLRKLRPGETRVLGEFVGLVCERRFTVAAVRTEQGLLRLRQNPSRAIEYISYVRSAPASVGCGPLTPAPRVLATYTTEGRIPLGIQGDAVVIEFIPANFVP